MSIWRALCIYQKQRNTGLGGIVYPAEFLCRVLLKSHKTGEIVHVRQHPAGTLAEAVEVAIDWENRTIPNELVRIHPKDVLHCQMSFHTDHPYGYEPLPDAYHPLVNRRFKEAEKHLAMLRANYFK